jgi:hypothetical protein
MVKGGEDMRRINCRIGNLELSTTKTIGGKEYLEIVEYFKEGNCMTIAIFEKDDDGISYLEFVGDRPLRPIVNWIDFEKLIRLGYDFINEEFYREG